MSPVRSALALSLVIVAACDAAPAPTTVDGGPDATGVADAVPPLQTRMNMLSSPLGRTST